jgi:PST family polysaccharide transporter
MRDFTGTIIRGGAVKVAGQGAGFFLRIGSLMALGRLLHPRDFGLVGMVTAVTGALGLFRDFGLSAATVQHADVSEDQLSTVFWINVALGGLLALVCVALAPAIASIYHEPRLFWIACTLAGGFLLNGAGVQQSAILQRQMRFVASAALELTAVLVSVVVGVGMALGGFGYWALAIMAIVPPAVTTAGAWWLTGWIPSRQYSYAKVRPMMRFGSTLTLNGLVVYVVYNLDKFLLGRYWGAGAVGLYGRAYQLASIPTESLNFAIGGVAFSALSRLREDPVRLKSYFLKGYFLVLALTIPITVLCAAFADDLIAVVLGPKWSAAANIFRLLAPSILISALINPLTWLIFSLGLVGRSLKVALVLAPLVIGGYLIGLPHGPEGVALVYSSVMTVWVVPHMAWLIHGTVLSLRDIGLTASRPLLAAAVAAIPAMGIQFLCSQWTPLPRLLLGTVVALAVYAGMLLYALGQKEFFKEILRGLKVPREAPAEGFAVPVSDRGN